MVAFEMRLGMVVFVLLFVLLAGLTQANEVNSPVEIPSVSSFQLLNQSFFYDNKTVIYVGEVVGPVMVRGDYAWVNVYDGTYAIGVWCPKEYAEKIKTHGDYNNGGDTVEVTGIFHRACASHGGDLDIHCSSMKVVAVGYPVGHPVDISKVFIAFILSLIAITLGWIGFRWDMHELRTSLRSYLRW